jgi:hypothetical protein
LNIAQGNGKGADADRRRFFAIARGSVSACGSIRDCPEGCKAPTAADNLQGRTLLDRFAADKARTAKPRSSGESGGYQNLDYDDDNDNDNDNDNSVK